MSAAFEALWEIWLQNVPWVGKRCKPTGDGSRSLESRRIGPAGFQ